MLKNTGEICIVTITDENKKEGIRYIDIGNYYITPQGKKCVVTTLELAIKYSHLIHEDIYVMKKN